MGKDTKTVIVAVCDRCNREGDTSDSEGRQEWGEMTVGYRGHIGSSTWQGDAAGTDHHGKKWLCLHCAKAFLRFMSGQEGGAL